jgi:ribosomal protein L12E/L44/L45/RPP1/RPP2
MSIETEILMVTESAADAAIADIEKLRKIVVRDIKRVLRKIVVDGEGNIGARAELRNLTTIRTQALDMLEELGARAVVTIAERRAATAAEDAASILRAFLRATDPLFDPAFLPDFDLTVQQLLTGRMQQVAQTFGIAVDEVRQAILVGTTTGAPLDDLILDVQAKINTTFKRAEATVETAVISAGRAVIAEGVQRVEQVRPGLFLLRYVGPLDRKTRPFCRKMLTGVKVHTVEAVERMSNGTPLPVIQSCGGFRCRHAWAPITREEAQRRGFKIGGV